ncbi:MAG: hypothetical protein WD431_05150, partial [Cyclobacteriaceae bacterium]
MIENLPIYISLLFGGTVIGTIAWFYFATRSRKFLIFSISWTLLQSILGLNGVYLDTDALPPKILLFGILPTLVLMLLVFLIPKGKAFIDRINLKTLTYFNTIRIPVEIVLTLLFHQGLVSVYMTVEGTNFDLFSGLTAGIVAYVAFSNGLVKKKLLLGWHVVCFLLLLNVVITAVFALPSPFQKLSLTQPNVAVLYFPFNLLPSVVVP